MDEITLSTLSPHSQTAWRRSGSCLTFGLVAAAVVVALGGCGLGSLDASENGERGASSTLTVGSEVEICASGLSVLNMRRGPGLSHPLAGLAEVGARGRVLALEGGWVEVELPSLRGWINALFTCLAGAGAPGSPPDKPVDPDPAQPDPPQPQDPEVSFIRFTTPKAGAKVEPTVDLAVETSSDVARVEYWVDQWQVGVSSKAPDFAAKRTFSQLGDRVIRAYAYDGVGTKVAETSVAVFVDGGQGSCVMPFAHPSPGAVVTSEYGWRWGRMHHGIDLGISYKTVYAAQGGKVTYRGWYDGYGYTLDISHTCNGSTYTTRYAHLSSYLVNSGAEVTKSQAIAVSGNTGVGTGAHLHFEIRLGGPWASSTNPRNYIAF
jgi:murein DD-endopeptidase MepM/ murein hydrolase activator NlpD